MNGMNGTYAVIVNGQIQGIYEGLYTAEGAANSIILDALEAHSSPVILEWEK